MLDVDSARLLLRIDEEDICDDELKKYINHFTLSTLARLGLSAQQDQKILDTLLEQLIKPFVKKKEATVSKVILEFKRRDTYEYSKADDRA